MDIRAATQIRPFVAIYCIAQGIYSAAGYIVQKGAVRCNEHERLILTRRVNCSINSGSLRCNHHLKEDREKKI